jgi:quercetin dioxygenase-like cupin family protein
MSNLSEAGAAQDTFTTGDAIPWKPADPRMPNGVQLYVVWGNPNEGASGLLLKFPAGTDVGWHWPTAAYQSVVIQGRFTHTLNGSAKTGASASRECSSCEGFGSLASMYTTK